MSRCFLIAIFIFTSCGNDNESRNSEVKIKNQFSIETNENQSDNALTFINAYVENCNKNSQSLGVIDWVNASTMTTMTFKAELKKVIDEIRGDCMDCDIDTDPIFAAQDYPDKGFELESIDSTKKLIKFKGKNWPEFKLTIKMVKENEKWLVDGCGLVNTGVLLFEDSK